MQAAVCANSKQAVVLFSFHKGLSFLREAPLGCELGR